MTGALLDSYVAGFWARDAQDKVLKDDDLRVGTVIDHQFAYGFVVDGVLKQEKFTKCLRQKLNRMETDITSIIQSQAKTMEVSSLLRRSSSLKPNVPWGPLRAALKMIHCCRLASYVFY